MDECFCDDFATGEDGVEVKERSSFFCGYIICVRFYLGFEKIYLLFSRILGRTFSNEVVFASP